eukprot:s683_g12.t1
MCAATHGIACVQPPMAFQVLGQSGDNGFFHCSHSLLQASKPALPTTMPIMKKPSAKKAQESPAVPPLVGPLLALQCAGPGCPSWVWFHRLYQLRNCQVCGLAWLSSYLCHGTTLKYVPEQKPEVGSMVMKDLHETTAKVEPKKKAKASVKAKAAAKASPKASAKKAMKTMKVMKLTMKAKK